ncbi:MAG: membrane protein insertion efficiency factor YidD [Candidatus Omnitrophica bacterium]|nr:membrane protein insertion efficiency factor YidD [Candidatus Omnitrophota bacterium]
MATQSSQKQNKTPIQTLAVFAVLFLSKLLNPFGRHVCRFHPGCTAYAVTAIHKHKLSTSFRLIVKRLLSCRPFGRYGYDPVPE